MKSSPFALTAAHRRSVQRLVLGYLGRTTPQPEDVDLVGAYRKLDPGVIASFAGALALATG